jgi:general secretion pathway protein J
MRRGAQSGFTLIELVLAVTLLAIMMAMLYSGLAFALRSWDAGDANGRRVADRRIAENFVRRELTELFPMRWKDPLTLKLALDGKPDSLRFTSSRPAGVSVGGLSLVGLAVEPDPVKRTHRLVMRRALPDKEAKDFGPLEKADVNILMGDIDSVKFGYFGADNDFTEPRWEDSWKYAGRVPLMVRMQVKDSDGTLLPEMVVRIALSEEAGCLENAFQRGCRPRMPTP